MGPLHASANQVISLTYSLLPGRDERYEYRGVVHGAAWAGVEQRLLQLRPPEKGIKNRRHHDRISKVEAAAV